MRTVATGHNESNVGRAAKTYRGSRRRLRRISLRGNWSFELLLFVAWLLFCLLVLVPWLVQHPPTHGHQNGDSPAINSGR